MLVAFNVTTYCFYHLPEKLFVWIVSAPSSFFFPIARCGRRHRATPLSLSLYTQAPFNKIIAQTNSISCHRLNIHIYLFAFGITTQSVFVYMLLVSFFAFECVCVCISAARLHFSDVYNISSLNWDRNRKINFCMERLFFFVFVAALIFLLHSPQRVVDAVCYIVLGVQILLSTAVMHADICAD